MVRHTPPHPEVALNLALAVVASSHAPLLLLDGDLTVIAASTSFCRAFQIDPASVPRRLSELGAGEWDVPQLGSLLRATASGSAEIEAYEMDLNRNGRETRRLVLHAHKLDYANEDNVRILLTVSDVTDARVSEKLKDDLLREKAILLQELQHRVANSLQIIASVLLQSARRVQSDATRSHLYDAHLRVMSVAAVQKQLAVSRLGDVELRPYFTDLCQSLGASMIRDHNQLSLEVSADPSITSADVSVSLGLIVTELVINALKHAFPGHRSGTITVGYHSNGPAWTLSVGDNGVGMPTDRGSAKVGLGTSLVEALARQLQARVMVADTNPGTMVSIVHMQSAAVDGAADTMPPAMTFDKANQAVGRHLMSGATLEELKAAASDLHALSQGSALADLVDVKIKQVLSESRQMGPAQAVEMRSRQESEERHWVRERAWSVSSSMRRWKILVPRVAWGFEGHPAQLLPAAEDESVQRPPRRVTDGWGSR